jgi:hypothetical protein
MSKKRGTSQKEKLQSLIDASIKKASPADLERLLITELGYAKADFQPEHVTKLRKFGALLLRKLCLDDIEKLSKMNEVVRSAAIQSTSYLPPDGAAVFFQVRVKKRSFSFVHLGYFCPHRDWQPCRVRRLFVQRLAVAAEVEVDLQM